MTPAKFLYYEFGNNSKATTFMSRSVVRGDHHKEKKHKYAFEKGKAEGGYIDEERADPARA